MDIKNFDSATLKKLRRRFNVEGIHYFNLILEHGPNHLKTLRFLCEHPNALNDFLSYFKRLDSMNRENKGRCKAVESEIARMRGFMYWQLINGRGKNNYLTLMFRKDNPSAEEDLLFFEKEAKWLKRIQKWHIIKT